MLFNDSFEKIKNNFLLLEENKKKERKMNIVELIFIIFSILIMIPYEMATTFEWLKIFGGLNLFCDIVFVILLYRLWLQYKKGIASAFSITTDILAAIPGIAAIIVFLISKFVFKDFNAGEFIASGGLALQSLKTTKFLRILRVTRLFRIIRNIKVLKFISMKSDSTSCESAVGWIGFVLLILLILSNFTFMFFGPIALLEDDFNNKLNALKTELDNIENITDEIIIQTSAKYGLNNKILYIEHDGEKKYFNKLSQETEDKSETMLNIIYCGLNSTLLSVKNINILIDDGEIFIATKRNNLLWILVIIFVILLFSFIITIIIGQNFTDYMNDYRKVIIDSYQGVESSFNLDSEKLSKNDRDSFAYAISLFTEDFVKLVQSIKELENKINLRDKEIQDLNDNIEDLEKEIESGDDNSNTKDILEDLNKTIQLIKKLTSKNPDVINKINKVIKFKTIDKL